MSRRATPGGFLFGHRRLECALKGIAAFVRAQLPRVLFEPLGLLRIVGLEGPLLASNGEPRGTQLDRRAAHKHALRKAFHGQLRHWWEVSPFLSNSRGGYDILKVAEPEGTPKRWDEKPFLHEVLADHHNINGRRFVPLVCSEFNLLCKLDILLLRRDRPGGIFEARDIDNRLKTLFDALRMPKHTAEIAQCGFDPNDDDPMFVLLQDDSLISTVSVETDELLDPPSSAGRDDSLVRCLVTVDIRPYQSTMFNLSFA